MAVKLLYYFVIIFLGIMAFLLMQNPYKLQENKSKSKQANIEILGMKNYSITKNGVDSIVIAKRVLRYDTHDEFYNINAIRKQKNSIVDIVRADKGSLVKNDLKLDGNVRYKRSDGVKFNSNEALYNLDSKVFKTNDNFILEDNKTITYGSSLVYQMKEGKIYAKNIRSIAEVNKK